VPATAASTAPVFQAPVAASANERFKKSFAGRFWLSLIVATALHFLVLAGWPSMTVADVSISAHELEAVKIPPEIPIPPAPESLERPAVPVPGVDVPPDETIAPTIPGEEGFAGLPPPPDDDRPGLAEEPVWVPHTVRPDVKNRHEVARVLEREYPVLLRDAGIGGTVIVWFFIDDEGTVRDTRIHRSSGHDSLDRAALRVADVFEFTPALNRDTPVPVWIQIPIRFTTR